MGQSRIIQTRLDGWSTSTNTGYATEKHLYSSVGLDQFFENTAASDATPVWSAAKTRIYINAPDGICGVFEHDPDATTAATASLARLLLTDYLGSIDIAVDFSNGVAVVVDELTQKFSYDPWGCRRNPSSWTSSYSPDTEALNGVTELGYTGHEMLDDLGLVNMNGRIYDPVLKRFLSADPTVQFAGFADSYNRYSYCLNNPLRYVDPSGYSLWSSAGGFWTKNWKTIVVVVVTVVVAICTAGVASGWVAGWGGAWASATTASGLSTLGAAAVGAMAGAAAGFAGGFVGTMLAGGSIGAALSNGMTGAGWGALSGALAGAIGGYFEGTKDFLIEVKRAAAHGISGGVVDALRGGSFGSGFAASFFSCAATHGLGLDEWNIYAGAAAAAVIGGTSCAIGGGKFKNGAMCGAFQYLFNAVSSKYKEMSRNRITVSTEVDGDCTRVTISGRVVFVRYATNKVMDADNPNVIRWVDGIKSAWSGLKDGYDVTVNISVLDTRTRDAITIYVYEGTGQPHMDQFFMDSTTGMDAAHEFGHDLGLQDLYRGSAGLEGNALVYYSFRDTSIMGRYDKTGITGASQWDIQWAIELNQ